LWKTTTADSEEAVNESDRFELDYGLESDEEGNGSGTNAPSLIDSSEDDLLPRLAKSDNDDDDSVTSEESDCSHYSWDSSEEDDEASEENEVWFSW